MTALVAALYVLGALLTIGAAVWAYFQARSVGSEIEGLVERLRQKEFARQRTQEDKEKLDNNRHGPFVGDDAEQQRATIDQELAKVRSELARQDAEIREVQTELDAAEQKALRKQTRMHRGDSQRLPMLTVMWVAAAEVQTFRKQGLVALVGIVISTVASVWSLYLD